MKEKLLALGLLAGAALVPVMSPGSSVAAQAQVPKPTPTPVPAKPAASPAPAAKPAAAPAPAPRAGGFPMELAMPLLAGGTAALGGGAYLLRRGKKRE